MANLTVLTATLRKAYGSAEKGKFALAASQALTVLTETAMSLGAGGTTPVLASQLYEAAWGLIEEIGKTADATSAAVTLAEESSRNIQSLIQTSPILKSNPRR